VEGKPIVSSDNASRVVDLKDAGIYSQDKGQSVMDLAKGAIAQ